MARLRSAPSSQQPAPTKQSARQALKEKTNTTAVGAPAVQELKDFVIDARPIRTRGRAREAAQHEDELVMAGGLGQKSDVPTSEIPLTTDKLARSDGVPPPTAKANRRPARQARKPAKSETQNKVFEDMKKRMRATAQKEAAGDKIVDAPARSDRAGPLSDALPSKPQPTRASSGNGAERSGFPIPPSSPPAGRQSAVRNKRSSISRPESVLKSQSTPAAETSVLALKNFKRRPRQPSMLAMVQQRAASARPSAAHTQQATEIERDDSGASDLDDGDEDEEFAPDAEGTPLHLRKAKRTSAASQRMASPMAKVLERAHAGPKKRKSDDVESSVSSLSALRVKRQKSARCANEQDDTPQPEATPEVQVINSSPASTPPIEPSITGRQQRLASAGFIVPSTHENAHVGAEEQIPLNDIPDDDGGAVRDETMADPLSSSPLPEDPKSLPETDIMADPLTQLTPPRRKRDQERAEKKARQMMTATLQSLLPKRRQPLRPRRRKSEYDVDSNSDQSDVDEESEDDAGAASRRRIKTAAAKPRESTAVRKASPAAKKSAASTQKTRKSAAPPSRPRTATASKKATGKTARTFGRNAASDKENEPADSDFEELPDNDDSALPDTSLTMNEATEMSVELAAAKAKFAEVDGWDMEFESVSFDEGRSSSQTWR